MTQTANSDTWSAERYTSVANFVFSAKYTSAVLELLAPKQGDRIVDFGCGSGEVTKQLEAIVGDGGLVVGYDASGNMVNKARAHGVTHAHVADLQVPKFYEGADSGAGAVPAGSVDAVFSNATLHWCKRDPAAVVRNAHALLRPGGTFAAEFGGFTNCIGVRSALHAVLRARGLDPEPRDPWYFPSAEEYRKVLEAEGFAVAEIGLHPRLTVLNGPLVDWLELFARAPFLADKSDAEAREILMEVQNVCERDCKDADGNWAMLYTRLRFKAEKPQ